MENQQYKHWSSLGFCWLGFLKFELPPISTFMKIPSNSEIFHRRRSLNFRGSLFWRTLQFLLKKSFHKNLSILTSFSKRFLNWWLLLSFFFHLQSTILLEVVVYFEVINVSKFELNVYIIKKSSSRLSFKISVFSI